MKLTISCISEDYGIHGMTLLQIAHKYHVSRTTVSKFIKTNMIQRYQDGKKLCPKCQEKKDILEFTVKNKIKDHCIACHRKRKRDQYYAKHEENKERQRIRARKRKPRQLSVEQRALINARRREYYQENKSRINKNRNLYFKKRLKRDVAFKIRHSLRIRLNDLLRENDLVKTSRAIDLLGCSVIELKQHLESRFQPGMTWDNYGRHGWHIDHIRPCCSFDLTDPEQQKQCFHWSNMQPLWARENLIKNGKYEFPINS